MNAVFGKVSVILKNKNNRTALLVFFAVLFLYLANLPHDYKKNIETQTHRRLLTSSDVIGNTFLPYLLYNYHTLDYSQIIDEMYMYIKTTKYYVLAVGDNLYPKYPIMTGLMAVPFYLPALLLDKISDLNTIRNVYKVLVLGRIAASMYASFSVALLYLIMQKIRELKPKITESPYDSKLFWLFILLYAFGSGTYTISSRVLWQHTAAQFVISMSILLFLYSFKNPRLLKWQGLLMGILVLIRTTNIVVAVSMAIYVFHKFRKEVVWFVLMALPAVVFLAIYNTVLFGSPFVEGYQLGDDLRFDTPLYIGIFGLLFSFGKGFLFTMPPFFFGIFELIKSLVAKPLSNLDMLLKYLGAAFILGFLLVAKWRGWDGADRFGPGLLTDLLPIIAIFSYLLVTKIRKKVFLVLFFFMTIYSILVNTNAVIFRKSRCASQHNWTFYCLSPPDRMPEY